MATINTLQPSTNGRFGQSRPIQEAPPALDLSALQTASQVLHEQFLKDAQAVPELTDMLSIRTLRITLHLPLVLISTSAAGVPSSASYSVFPDDYRVPYHKKRLVSIPDSLFQYYNSESRHVGASVQVDTMLE